MRFSGGLALCVCLAAIACGKAGPCPDGAKLTGQKPPGGTEQWCAKEAKAGNIIKHGRWTQWHESGGKAEEGVYRDNLKAGEWTTWNKKGQKSSHGIYRAGKFHGAYERWHSNGQIAERGSYTSGMKDGAWSTWDDGGTKIEERNFDGTGKRLGVKATAFPEATKAAMEHLNKAVGCEFLVPGDDVHVVLSPGEPCGPSIHGEQAVVLGQETPHLAMAYKCSPQQWELRLEPQGKTPSSGGGWGPDDTKVHTELCVIAHELGHILGLQDNYDRGSMNPRWCSNMFMFANKDIDFLTSRYCL